MCVSFELFGIVGRSRIADMLDDIVCLVGVPHIFGARMCVFDATCASLRIVCDLHPESTAASCCRSIYGSSGS